MISPRGFAIALAILIVAWMFVPNEARWPLAILLFFLALGMNKEAPKLVDSFFALLR